MNLSELAQRNHRLLFLLVAGMMALGAASYGTLPAREDPSILVREAIIQAPAPGLPASQVELLVTRTIEEKLRAIPETKEITSVSMTEMATIHIKLKDKYFDLDQLWDEVRKKVAEAQRELPRELPAPIVNTDFGDVAVVTAAISGEDFAVSELFDLAKHARDRLQSVQGTKKVEIVGTTEERVFIELDEVKLAELALNPDLLARQLAARNILGAQGSLTTGGRRLLVRPTGRFESVDAIRRLLVTVPGGLQAVPLGELATVTRGYEDPLPRLAYVNGKRSLILTIAMMPDERVLEFAPRVLERIDEVRSMLPAGVALEIFNYQADAVSTAVFGVTLNVIETLGIVLAVVILFLGVRTGLIVGAIVPSVMLITIGIMGFAGMNLQRMSLATLVIALGLLVDNGIVVAEDFKRRLEAGEHPDAALSGVGRELALPLLSSTLTTVLVFLPLMLAENASGEYTRSISQVILISLLTSWALAMTVTPLLCHRFIKIKSVTSSEQRQGVFDGLSMKYGAILRGILRRPMTFLAGMLALLVASGAAMALVPVRFFPDSNRAQVIIYLDLAPDASIEATDAAARRVLAALDDERRFPHIEKHAGYVGFGGPRFVLSLAPNDPAPHRATIVINVDSLEHMESTMSELRDMLEAQVPEAEGRVTRMFLGPSDSSKLTIQAKGPDKDVVFGTARRIEEILRGVPGAFEVRSDWEGLISTIELEVDEVQAQRVGATSQQVAQAIERVLSGVRVGEYRDGDDLYPIMLRGQPEERTNLASLQTAAVSVAGGTVPLNQVASVRFVTDHSTIAREDLERTVSVEARNRLMTAEDTVPRVKAALEALQKELPPGHRIEFDGVVADSAESQAALNANIPLCMGIMVLLLVAQFRSYRRPAIILGTIPLVLIGAVMGLLVTRANFGFMVILGLYSLAGIIINNAIVLIDRIDIERAASDGSEFEAVVSASVRRLRPILMTTVTTILGLAPLIVFVDPLFYGMASAIAFGLLVGTLLTLGVVPAAYALFFGIRAPRGVTR